MTTAFPRDGVPSVVTIGKFDGVHVGHREVLAQLSERANGRRVVAVTFDRHPAELFDPTHAPKPLLSVAQKVEALEAAGADRVVVIPFTAEFASQSPESFVNEVLIEGLSAELVLVGSDFRFGQGGAGSIDTLIEAGREQGFEVVCLDDVCVDGAERVSSSAIRDALAAGEAETATRLLGRPHRVRGIVVHGHQRGRELGFPTANLEENCEGLIPRAGVYGGTLTVGGERFVAGISVGRNPTFTDVTRDQVEAHAIDAEFDAYGQVAEIEFTHWIRESLPFESIDALIIAMDGDIAAIRELAAKGAI